MSTNTLTDRALNRATLARQMLLERSSMSATSAAEWLIGQQAQQSNDPYIGLWSRLRDFRHEDLTALIVDRTLVRATSFRATLHLHSVDDLLGLRPHLQATLDRMWKSNFGNRRFGGNDAKAVHRAGVKLLDKGPTTGGQLGKALQEKFPAGDALSKSVLLQVREILIQIPPTRLWGSGHAPILTRAQNWVPAPHRRPLKLADLVRRYLRAYGPASVADMQSWSGLTRLGEVFTEFGDELITFIAEDGRVLYDLPDAPRPSPETPAPPRFLPLYDNVYLGYDNRRRMLNESDLKRVNLLAEFKPAVLVDGVIAAGWAIEAKKGRAVLSIEPYHQLRKSDVRALEKEGEAFLRFMEPDSTDRDIVVTAVRD
jgi:hypothetical protein